MLSDDHNSIIDSKTASDPIAPADLDGVINPEDMMLRSTTQARDKASKRRVSCQDLGKGDCEGWLWKKKEKAGLLSKDWKKQFVKLKDKVLYFYKDKNDLIADGMLCMPAFVVSQCMDRESTKKFSFKLRHSCCGTFFLASENQDDMNKWIKILQLACLPNVIPMPGKLEEIVTEIQKDEGGQLYRGDPGVSGSNMGYVLDTKPCRNRIQTLFPIKRPTITICHDDDAYSGASSEDEEEAGNGNVIQRTTGSIDENSHADESPNGDICPVPDKTVPGMTTIKEDQESDDSVAGVVEFRLALDAVSFTHRARFTSMAQITSLARTQSKKGTTKDNTLPDITSLKRSLKAKEEELMHIERFLKQTPITSSALRVFRQTFEDLLTGLGK